MTLPRRRKRLGWLLLAIVWLATIVAAHQTMWAFAGFMLGGLFSAIVWEFEL